MLSRDARASAGEIVTRGGSTQDLMNQTIVQNEPRTAKIAQPKASTLVPTLARLTSALSPNVIVRQPDDTTGGMIEQAAVPA